MLQIFQVSYLISSWSDNHKQ